jgi:hypothetical protein
MSLYPISEFIQEKNYQYSPSFFDKLEAELFFSRLLDTIPWQQGTIKIFGKELLQPRLFCFMADEGIKYSYSNKELITFPCAREYVSDQPLCIWLDPVGDFTEQEPRQHDMGYNSASIGAFGGFDAKIHSKFRLGLNVGYTNSRVNWMDSVGKGIINSAYLAILYSLIIYVLDF